MFVQFRGCNIFDQDDSYRDRELIEEINRKYENGEEEPLDSGRRRAAGLAAKFVALLLALVFLCYSHRQMACCFQRTFDCLSS
jgi:hypothetical protein